MAVRTIDDLTAVTSLSGGDLVPVWSQSAGDSRKCSLNTLLTEFIEENFADPNLTIVRNTPASGSTVDLSTQTADLWSVLTPAGSLATLTITLPSSTSAFDGQTVLVTCSQAVTTLTVNSTGNTVSGAPTALAANGFFQMRYDKTATTWRCVAQSLGATSTFSDITITGDILDGNGNQLIEFTTVASAVNAVQIRNAATGNSPRISVEGSDANAGLVIGTQGTGNLELSPGGDLIFTPSSNTLTITASTATLNGSAIVTASSTTTLTNKSVSGGLTFITGTVASLPAAAVGNMGQRRVVTDSNAAITAGIGAVVAGGGANVVPVMSDGTNWRIV